MCYSLGPGRVQLREDLGSVGLPQEITSTEMGGKCDSDCLKVRVTWHKQNILFFFMGNMWPPIGEAGRLMHSHHSFGFGKNVYLLGRNVGPGTWLVFQSYSECSLAGLKHVSENWMWEWGWHWMGDLHI